MRLKVGLIAPCIGVGGGDALMLGLVKYAHNLEFTGVAVGNPIEIKHYEWAYKAIGNNLSIHSKIHDKEIIIDGINYHETYTQSIQAATRNCDVILMWCVHTLDRHVKSIINVPIVDYIQNSDNYAKSCIESNIDIVDFHVACSQTAAKLVNNCHVIYNGIDPGRVTPRAGGKYLRKIWGLENKKIALFMGRLVEEKHPESLLGALTELDDSWVVLYVGTGYKETEIYKQAQLLFPERVFWLEPQYHIGDILSAVDVFVLPSDFEGHSLALSEAWLAKCPTVYTNFDTMEELESMFGPLGVKVPKLCSNKELAVAMDDALTFDTTTAFNAVWNNFTITSIAARWEEYLHECVQLWRRQQRVPRLNTTLPRKEISYGR